jgi:hypothetical protein
VVYPCFSVYICVSGTYLDGVVEGQDVHALAVGHVTARGQRHKVAQTHTQVLAHHLTAAFTTGNGV